MVSIYVKTIIPGPPPELQQHSTAIDFAVNKLAFVPDEKQRLVLESQSRRSILNCSRRWRNAVVSRDLRRMMAFLEAT